MSTGGVNTLDFGQHFFSFDLWILYPWKTIQLRIVGEPMLMSDKEPNKYAGRELMAYGDENVFICHVSSVEEAGSFEIFREKILQSEAELETGILRADFFQSNFLGEYQNTEIIFLEAI